MGRTTSKVVHFREGCRPHLIHGSLSQRKSALPPPSKRHLSRFSRFAQLTRVANNTDTQTDRHTDHATCDICSNRSHLCKCVRCGITITDTDTATMAMVSIVLVKCSLTIGKKLYSHITLLVFSLIAFPNWQT